jgi:hypothetical protein
MVQPSRAIVLLLWATALPARAWDERERTLAAAEWGKGHDPVHLPRFDEKSPCVRLAAPQQWQCGKQVWLCATSDGAASCSGYGWTRVSAVFVESQSAPSELAIADAQVANPDRQLLLEYTSGVSPTGLECAEYAGFALTGPVTDEERQRARRRFAQQQAAQRQRCERELYRDSELGRTTISCALVLVDPCHREAFTLCSGRRGKDHDSAGLPPLHRVLRQGWVAPPAPARSGRRSVSTATEQRSGVADVTPN